MSKKESDKALKVLKDIEVKNGVVTFKDVDDKFKLKLMSIDDMDYCEDLLVTNQSEGTVTGFARATTAWIRAGVEDMTDERLRKLAPMHKILLEREIRLFNTLGEAKPSHSD